MVMITKTNVLKSTVISHLLPKQIGRNLSPIGGLVKATGISRPANYLLTFIVNAPNTDWCDCQTMG